MSAIVTPMPKPAQRGPGTGKRRSFVSSHTKATYQRAAHRSLAAVAAGFLPISCYALVHHEVTPERPWLWGLVAASLAYSAPTLADWAASWCQSKIKGWSFAILLEGTMIGSHILPLNITGLALLTVINSAAAWSMAGLNKNPTNLSELGGKKDRGASDVTPKE